VIACSIWRHVDLGVMRPMRVEGSQVTTITLPSKWLEC